MSDDKTESTDLESEYVMAKNKPYYDVSDNESVTNKPIGVIGVGFRPKKLTAAYRALLIGQLLDSVSNPG